MKFCDALVTVLFDQIIMEHHFNLNDRGDDTENKSLPSDVASLYVEKKNNFD